MTTVNNNWFDRIATVMDENADPRTKEWPLVSNPSFLILCIIAYLFFVCIYGPNYMKNKKPFDLKLVITLYNMGQIVACVYLFYAVLNAGWLDEYSLGCQPVDYSMNPKPYKMAKLVWWTMILKLTEFVETIFFVLRKKDNQISGLHIYHHVTTLILVWLGIKFTPGGMATFPILINCLVHIVMYAYYLAALQGGRELQKRLRNWKKLITIIQMVQFTIIILHSLSALRADCNVPNVLAYLFIPNVFVLYYMFYKFYKTAYKTD